MKKAERSKAKPIRIDAVKNAHGIAICYRFAKHFKMKITQKDIAAITGLSVRSIRAYLKNERSSPVL